MTQEPESEQKSRILTGDRPTGQLHLGHYIGSIKNRVELQDKYETFICIADLHTLTTKPNKENIQEIFSNAKEMATDYLAAGIDPEKTEIYLQSAIPEIYELKLILDMLVTVNRLTRLPSIKDMAKAAQISEESMPFGLLGYPVLQSADILLPRAHLVPVGKDNEAHIEITRELARRFNSIYDDEVFPEPDALIGDATLMGTDGSGKMSKSLNNAILLSEEENSLAKKVKKMYTDPNRVHANIPGKVEGNPVFQYLDSFCSDKGLVDTLKDRYRSGTVGDGEVKDVLLDALKKFLSPIQERRIDILADTGYVEELISRGTEKMRDIAVDTMRATRKAMGTAGNWNKLRRAIEKRQKRQK